MKTEKRQGKPEKSGRGLASRPGAQGGVHAGPTFLPGQGQEEGLLWLPHTSACLLCFLAVLPLARVRQALASRSLSPCHLPGSSHALSLVSLQGFFLYI